MDKQTLKNKLKIQAKSLAWRAITTVILTLIAVATVWVYAAFVEPSAGPADSDQDFVQNILGANNADNDFDSSAVATNKDGSIAERLEYITNRMTTAGQWYSTECADSTTTTKTNCYVDTTAKYVDTNACVNSANTGYCYMNTDTFTAMDADLTAAKIVSGNTIFGVAGSATVQPACDPTIQYYTCSGGWNYQCFGCQASAASCVSYCRGLVGGAAFCSYWFSTNCYCFIGQTLQYYGDSSVYATYCRS